MLFFFVLFVYFLMNQVTFQLLFFLVSMERAHKKELPSLAGFPDFLANADLCLELCWHIVILIGSK